MKIVKDIQGRVGQPEGRMRASRPRARVARPGPRGARGRCRTGVFTCRAVRVGAVASLRRLGTHFRNASESWCWEAYVRE